MGPHAAETGPMKNAERAAGSLLFLCHVACYPWPSVVRRRWGARNVSPPGLWQTLDLL